MLKIANNGVNRIFFVRCGCAGGGYGKPFYVSDINHQEKSGTEPLFLFVIKYLICCVSQLLVHPIQSFYSNRDS